MRLMCVKCSLNIIKITNNNMFRSIKLLKRLEIRKEVLFSVCVINSQKRERTSSVILNEYASVIKAVSNLRTKMPLTYMYTALVLHRPLKFAEKVRKIVLEEFGLNKDEYLFGKL